MSSSRKPKRDPEGLCVYAFLLLWLAYSLLFQAGATKLHQLAHPLPQLLYLSWKGILSITSATRKPTTHTHLTA